MKRIKIMGLCLVALFAMSAVMSAGAQAAPEFKLCVKATEKLKTKPVTYKDGEFSDKNCGVASPGGKYKVGSFAGAKKTAIKVSGGAGANFGWIPLNEKFEPSFPGTKLSATTCASEKGTGAYSATGATFKIEYKGCKDGPKVCTSPGAKAGVINDNPLEGTLVDLPEGKVGILIESVTEPGKGVLAEYNCEGLLLKATGSVIGEVQGASKAATKEPVINFQAGKEGVQQQWNYPTPAVSEAEGEMGAWGWSLEAIFAGNPAPATPKPNELITIVSGTESGTVPSQQGSKGTVKGELVKVVG
jgi:hypothetical protein